MDQHLITLKLGADGRHCHVQGARRHPQGESFEDAKKNAPGAVGFVREELGEGRSFAS